MEAGGMDLPILCLMRERGIDGLIDRCMNIWKDVKWV